MVKFSSLLWFTDGASAALRAIIGHVRSRPGHLSDYDGWLTTPAVGDDVNEILPIAVDPWLWTAHTQQLHVLDRR